VRVGWGRSLDCHCWRRLADEPGLETNDGRRKRRRQITQAIASELRGQPAEAWLGRFASAGIPAARMASLSEVIADPHVAARDSIRALPGSRTGPRVVTSPWRFARTAAAWRHVPAIGEHSTEILRELRIIEDETSDLWASGTVGEGSP